MIKISGKCTAKCFRVFSSSHFCTFSNFVDVSPEVKVGLKSNKPIVALESTIITHGMPFPKNLQTAIEVQNIVRLQGAIPATVAILNGRIKIGLSNEELKLLASPETSAIKSSRRDIPYVLSKNLNGGTTVSGTLLACSLVGIRIFVTGGIGGVHRNCHLTWDISADLNELGRHSIAVISSGVKSILDIDRTLEYLETQGVCVATFGKTRDFPAFYTRFSNVQSPYHVESVIDAAKLFKSLIDMNCNSGLLLGVSVPEEYELIKSDEMEKIIESALVSAERSGVKGKDITPYLLDKIKLITEGKSLETNIALIKNNALIGSQISVALSKLFKSSSPSVPSTVCGTYVKENVQEPVSESTDKSHASKVVVIGGSIADLVVKAEEDMKMDGRTIRGKVGQSSGGVGRNLADALGRLMQESPLLLSAVGDDSLGHTLLADIPHVDTSGVKISKENSTACCNVLLDKNGECSLIVGDMDVHKEITVQHVKGREEELKKSSLIVMDGNISLETMEYILQTSLRFDIPVWFEPTDITTATKPFLLQDLWKSIKFLSPNIRELLEISQILNKDKLNLDFNLNMVDDRNVIDQAITHAFPLVSFVPNILVTLGSQGVLLLSHLEGRTFDPKNISINHYEPPIVSNIVNVSGAGDCLAAGFITGRLCGLPESESVSIGIQAAALALQTNKTVPDNLNQVAFSKKNITGDKKP